MIVLLSPVAACGNQSAVAREGAPLTAVDLYGRSKSVVESVYSVRVPVRWPFGDGTPLLADQGIRGR